jgi:hypothetical protein
MQVLKGQIRPFVVKSFVQNHDNIIKFAQRELETKGILGFSEAFMPKAGEIEAEKSLPNY